MNKRIKKKRMKLDNRTVGDNVYSSDVIKHLNQLDIVSNILYPMTKMNPQVKWRKKNLKRAMNYMLKHLMKYIGSMYRYRSHYEKPLILKEGSTTATPKLRRIPGGQCFRYHGNVVVFKED